MGNLSDFISAGGGIQPLFAGDTSDASDFSLTTTWRSMGTVSNVPIPANGFIIVALRNCRGVLASGGPIRADVRIRVNSVDHQISSIGALYTDAGAIQMGYSNGYEYTLDHRLDGSSDGKASPNSNHVVFNVGVMGIASGTQNVEIFIRENSNNGPVGGTITGTSLATKFSIYVVDASSSTVVGNDVGMLHPPFLELPDPTFNTHIQKVTTTVTATTSGILLCTFPSVVITADTWLTFLAAQYKGSATSTHGTAAIGLRVNGTTHWHNTYSSGISGHLSAVCQNESGGPLNFSGGFTTTETMRFHFSVETFGISTGTHNVEVWIKKSTRTSGVVTLSGTGFQTGAENNAIYCLEAGTRKAA